MRKLSLLLMMFALLVTGAGCDGDGNDGPSDADTFVGSWSIGGISDGSGDRTESFVTGFNSVVISFAANGDFSLVVDAIDDAIDASIPGTYSINESASALSVSIDQDGTAIPLSFTYTIVNDNRIDLEASSTTSAVLGLLFQTSFSGAVEIALVKGQN